MHQSEFPKYYEKDYTRLNEVKRRMERLRLQQSKKVKLGADKAAKYGTSSLQSGGAEISKRAVNNLTMQPTSKVSSVNDYASTPKNIERVKGKVNIQENSGFPSQAVSAFWSNRSKKDEKFRFSLDKSLNPPESQALRNRRISGQGLTSREVRKRIKTDYNLGMD